MKKNSNARGKPRGQRRTSPGALRSGTQSPARSSVKAAARQNELMGALELLRQRRKPYEGPLADIVAQTLQRFLPPAAVPAPTSVPSAAGVVEIGAGIGQLRSWLPPERRRDVVHTDVSAAALRTLRANASGPPARAVLASASALPFADGSCGAVLGLCVFDAIAEAAQATVVQEIRRVLRPGGKFIHFLDMATLLEAPFKKLVISGLVPLPNVFGDPADEEWPVDLALVKQAWLLGLMDFALRTGHPLAAAFGDLFAAFLKSPDRFEVDNATSLFKSIASDGQRRHALATLLASASLLAAQWGHPPLQPIPFHSGKYLASVLQTAFGDDQGFRVELCEILTGSSWVASGDDPRPVYQSLCLGHQRIMDSFPNRLLTGEARLRLATPGAPAAAQGTGETLVEVGVFVFVAERL